MEYKQVEQYMHTESQKEKNKRKGLSLFEEIMAKNFKRSEESNGHRDKRSLKTSDYNKSEKNHIEIHYNQTI